MDVILSGKDRLARPANDRPRPGLRLSASLDVARALAACYVIVQHVTNARGWSEGPGVVFRFGQEAVLVFFLLSGFVIFLNEHTRASGLKGYYLRRIRRIYPPLAAAMVVSTLVAIDNGVFFSQFSFAALVGTIANLQDISALKPGVITDPYLHNDPLWSLSYEVAFYAVFPFVLRLGRRFPALSNHFIGLLCCFAYVSYVLFPNHWSLVAAYFLVWWCGAMAADAYLKGARYARSIRTSLFWLLILAIVAAAAVFIDGYHGLGYYPFLMFRHFAFALILLIILFGSIGRSFASRLARFSKPAAAVASLSYGLYVLHFPLLVEWNRAKSNSGLIAATFLLAIIAYLVDRKIYDYLPKAPAD